MPTTTARDLFPLKSNLRAAAEAMPDSEQKATALRYLDFAGSCLCAGEHADKVKVGAMLITAAGIVWGATATASLCLFADAVTKIMRN